MYASSTIYYIKNKKKLQVYLNGNFTESFGPLRQFDYLSEIGPRCKQQICSTETSS